MQSEGYDDCIRRLAALCAQTSAAILPYHGDRERLRIRRKSNHTPLTEADLAAHRLLIAGLPAIVSLPVISEESQAGTTYRHPSDYWLIDPIDGTREFIAGSDEFCIVIARIRHYRPVLGFIHCPTSGRYWYAIENHGAYLAAPGKTVRRLRCRRPEARPTIITAQMKMSRRMRTYLTAAFGAFEHATSGSALKFCAIAEGKADIYPKISATTSEWDTAAGDILLHEAGGGLSYFGNTHRRYGLHETPVNPPFIAYGVGHTPQARQCWFDLMTAQFAAENRAPFDP